MNNPDDDPEADSAEFRMYMITGAVIVAVVLFGKWLGVFR